jgi:hypothetical protein
VETLSEGARLFVVVTTGSLAFWMATGTFIIAMSKQNEDTFRFGICLTIVLVWLTLWNALAWAGAL